MKQVYIFLILISSFTLSSCFDNGKVEGEETLCQSEIKLYDQSSSHNEYESQDFQTIWDHYYHSSLKKVIKENKMALSAYNVDCSIEEDENESGLIKITLRINKNCDCSGLISDLSEEIGERFMHRNDHEVVPILDSISTELEVISSKMTLINDTLYSIIDSDDFYAVQAELARWEIKQSYLLDQQKKLKSELEAKQENFFYVVRDAKEVSPSD